MINITAVAEGLIRAYGPDQAFAYAIVYAMGGMYHDQSEASESHWCLVAEKIKELARDRR